ncbi:MAG TPA: hypothetical protein IAB68_05260 [Candidatus Aphodocola excrementigallinarum]|uniref:Bacteriocin n=1 Tax=Candidatus Aphodocola excrementigallinarum TaxID=2840670 RepID=A0A9D1LI65_9FIRM|nr:hypothetical protein [Candidatus Aphodocola excrementigallinarum]
MRLNKNELKMIKAGASISATLVNALIKGFTTFMDVGRYLGSSIRRLFGNSACPLK